MGYIEATADFDTAVIEAGDRFVSQVQPVLHPRSLAVVLLNSGGHPGQVAFTWGPPHRFGTSHCASLALTPSPADIPEHSLRINLQGREGSLGAVLFRGDFPPGCDYEQAEPLQAITRQLALTLENIQLKERLRRKSIEDQALENIASLVAANLPPGPLYWRFADEVKQLTRYDRITFYLADETGGNLSRVCQLGLGVCRSEPGPKRDLGSAACESLVSSGTGLIIQDKPQLGASLWPDLDDDADLRSALIAPVRHSDEVAAVVALESRWPNAYGPAELGLLSKAAELLRPWVANLRLDRQLQGNAKELAVIDEMGKALGSLDGLEQVFGHMAKAVSELIPFDHATVTWIDPAGSELSALHWPGGASRAVYFNNVDCPRLQTCLVFGNQEIGALSLTREGGSGFTVEDSRVLERLALQVAPVIQNARFAIQGARAGDGQALQVQRSKRAGAVHELRAPLTAIKGYSSALLQSDVSWPPEIYREFLETIDRETDRLDHVVGDLLLAVDSQPNLLSLNLQHASIDVLFDLAQADLELVDWSKAVTFQCEPGLPVALVDPTHLVRALGHLIRCAAECTLPGEAIQVKACRRQGGPAIVIGTVNPVRPGKARSRRQQAPSLYKDDRPARISLAKNLRVVVSRNLLDAHGAKLLILPKRRPTEIFSFPLPIS